MITLAITIETASYRQHVVAAEATDKEIIEKLQQDIGEAIQTYRHFPVIVDAIRHPRQDFGLTIPVHDTWVDLPEVVQEDINEDTL